MPDWLHTAEVRYNSGLHKGFNLAVYVAGWGLWIAATHDTSLTVAATDSPVRHVLIGVAYIVLGVLSAALIRTRAPLVGLSLVTGALCSITASSLVHAATHLGGPLSWPPTVYTYGSLTVIALSAIRDYMEGLPYGR